jgi:hypothetical protein
MEEFVLYSNVVATFALGMLVASLFARAAQQTAAIRAVANDVPSGEAIEARVEKVLTKSLPNALDALMEQTKVRKVIARVLKEETERGLISRQVRETLDEQCRSIREYVANEVVPRAILERSGPIPVADHEVVV